MPVCSSPRPELLRRGDHAVRDVAVGLARGDRERTGQHRARQRHDDLVAGEEVARAAHDAVHGGAAVRGGLAVGRDAHLAPADRLAVGLRLLDELEHLADDDRTLQLEAVDVLLLEPDAHERREHVLGGGIRRHIDVLTQPRKRDAHQTTIPNCSLKRTSPSAMSRMSCTSLRNISVRSIPMPNAKPEYSSGSIPAARSTFGLIMPQPPHSIQRAPPLKVGCQRSSSARRLGEGEEVGAEARLGLGAEQHARGVVERALQVRHRDALVDDDALELREDRQVRRVELVGAVDAARAQHVDRHLALEHRAHLHGARVRAHHEVAVDRVDEERVLHLARGVVDVEVQRVEVVPLVLELGTLGDLPPHADEDVGDLLLQERDRMPRPDARARRRAP